MSQHLLPGMPGGHRLSSGRGELHGAPPLTAVPPDLEGVETNVQEGKSVEEEGRGRAGGGVCPPYASEAATTWSRRAKGREPHYLDLLPVMILDTDGCREGNL